MTTGELIKELRIKKGMTQEELAAKTDISVRTIQRIENGEVDPRAYTLHAISAALDIEYEFLNNNIDIDYKFEREKESKLWLPIMHLSGLFLLLFPSVIIWFCIILPKIRTTG
jgi:transcriptional regulator with XRE-family HTH domain